MRKLQIVGLNIFIIVLLLNIFLTGCEIDDRSRYLDLYSVDTDNNIPIWEGE